MPQNAPPLRVVDKLPYPVPVAVGLVTSVTYLTCAYTLPAWFALKLLAGRLSSLERAWLIAVIPITLCLSGVGLVASIKTYVIEAAGGEGM